MNDRHVALYGGRTAEERIKELEAERDQLRESYRAALEINTEIIVGAKRLQAEAWDEGANYAIAQAPADVWFEEWTKKLVNPYREAS